MGSEWVILKDLAKIKGGKRLPKGASLQINKNTHPYIRVKDMGERYIPKNGLQYVPNDIFPKIQNYIVETNDVIISIVGTVGLVSIIDEYFHHASQTENCAKLSGLDKYDAKYLYYYLISPQGQQEIFTQTVGAVQPKLPLYGIQNISVLWCEKVNREAISHILGSLDDKIELNRQMNETLESMAQALFKSWFVDFDPVIDNALAAGNPIPDVFAERAERRQNTKQQKTGGVDSKNTSNNIQLQFPSEFEYTEEMGWIPKGWGVEKLNELLEVKYGKDHKKLESGTIPVYGSGGLMRFVNKSLYLGESILIPRKGTLSNLMFVDEEFWTVDTMFFSIPKLKYSAKYLFYQLKMLDFSSMNVGSAVPSMTTKVLNDLNILKPKDNLLKEFDRFATDFFTRQKALDKANNSLSKLRDTLLPKLLSGELRISDAEKLIKEAGV